MAAEPARSAETPRFANDAERECARLLDFYGVPWEYEPRTFALEEAEDGRVTVAFTPDFYLPEAGMYVECTTAQPSLMARKRRKVRKARELHDLVITLHERHDFDRLRRRYADWKRTRR